ncbi:hypothetical protein N9X24_01275 [Rickettsiales bacterium]|nr:hypothetical protein [Rickettsiales bacterium]
MSNENLHQNSKINRIKSRNIKRLKAFSFFLLLPIIMAISSFIIIGGILSLILPLLLSIVICLNTIPAIFIAFNLKKPIWFHYLKIYGIHRREISEKERKESLGPVWDTPSGRYNNPASPYYKGL